MICRVTTVYNDEISIVISDLISFSLYMPPSDFIKFPPSNVVGKNLLHGLLLCFYAMQAM